MTRYRKKAINVLIRNFAARVALFFHFRFTSWTYSIVLNYNNIDVVIDENTWHRKAIQYCLDALQDLVNYGFTRMMQHLRQNFSWKIKDEEIILDQQLLTILLSIKTIP
jgi:hypothetical protein